MNTLKKLFSLLFVVSHLFCSEGPIKFAGSEWGKRKLLKVNKELQEEEEPVTEQARKLLLDHVEKGFKAVDAKWNAVWKGMEKLGLDVSMRRAAEKAVFAAEAYKILSGFYAPESIINFCAAFTWCVHQGYIQNNDNFITIINETDKPEDQYLYFAISLINNLNVEKYNEAKRECLLDLQYYIFDMFNIYDFLLKEKSPKKKKGILVTSLVENKNVLNTYYDLKFHNRIDKEHIRLKLNQGSNFLQDFRKEYIDQMNLLDKNDAARRNLHLDIMTWKLELKEYNEQKVKHDRSRRLFKLIGISSLLAVIVGGGALWWFKFRKK